MTAHAKPQFTPEEVTQILAQADAAKAARAASMPSEEAALNLMQQAYTRLQELGWSDAIYCPKDGSTFAVIEAGSTGVHEAYYEGEWPDGRWWVLANHDAWPSRPILWRPAAESRDSPGSGSADPA